MWLNMRVDGCEVGLRSVVASSIVLPGEISRISQNK